jgi:hypothetical protein
MTVYTIVFTFNSSSVARQVNAVSVPEALLKWAELALPASMVPNRPLVDAILETDIVAVNGLVNVWALLLHFPPTQNGSLFITATQVVTAASIYE